MQLILLILFAPILIVGCGNSSGGSPEEEAGQVEIPEQVIPPEVSYASTLFYPGADALYFGESIDYVGSIKADYRESTNAVLVTTDGFSARVDVDENGYWRVDGIPLNRSMINTVTVSLLSDDTVLHSDKYRVLRSPGKISSNIIGQEAEAYYFSYPANAIFQVDLTTGIIDPLMSVQAANRERRLSINGDRIYSADSHLGLWVHRISTRLTVAHFDLEQNGVDGISWGGPGGSLYTDIETGDIYYYTPSGYNGEAIDFHGDQIHVLYRLDPNSGALTEVSGGPRGSGDRFYYSSGGVFSSSNKAFYVSSSSGLDESYNLYRIDIASGDRTILLEDISQTYSPIGLSSDEDEIYLKVDSINGQLVSYDMDTGIISKRTVADTEDSVSYGFRSVVTFPGTTAVYLPNSVVGDIYRLDEDGNTKRVITGHLDKWSSILGYDHSYFDQDTGEVYFSYMDAIGKYSIDSGRGKIVTSDNSDYHDSIVGEGGNIGLIHEMLIDAPAETAYVFDSRSDLYSVNLTTGKRTEIPLVKPSGFDDFHAGGMDLNITDNVIHSSNGQQLFKVDIDNGEMSLLPQSLDDDLNFSSVSDIQYDNDRNVLWVSGRLPGASEVVKVDLESGQRYRVFEDLLDISIPASPEATYLSAAENTLYIIFQNSEIYAYDVETNQLSFIAKLALGDLSLGSTQGDYEIQYIHGLDVILATTEKGIFSVDVKTGRSAQFQ
jgi:sugar lactone lactonase YvrE